MSWQRRAIVACAAVVALSGVTSASAGAIAADRALSPAQSSTSAPPRSATDTASAYESQLTITLDQPGGSCASFPDADGRRPRQVCGDVLTCYRKLNGPQGPLGLPTGDESANRYRPAELGERMAPFRGGTVYRHDATGELSVGRWYVSSPSSPSTPPEPIPQC